MTRWTPLSIYLTALCYTTGIVILSGTFAVQAWSGWPTILGTGTLQPTPHESSQTASPVKPGHLEDCRTNALPVNRLGGATSRRVGHAPSRTDLCGSLQGDRFVRQARKRRDGHPEHAYSSSVTGREWTPSRGTLRSDWDREPRLSKHGVRRVPARDVVLEVTETGRGPFLQAFRGGAAWKDTQPSVETRGARSNPQVINPSLVVNGKYASWPSLASVRGHVGEPTRAQSTITGIKPGHHLETLAPWRPDLIAAHHLCGVDIPLLASLVGRSEMSPAFTSSDPAYELIRNSERKSNLSLGTDGIPNLEDLRFIKFCLLVGAPGEAGLSSLLPFVCHVVGVGAKKEMRGVHAPRIIAMMTNALFFRDGVVVYLPRESVGHYPLQVSEIAVPPACLSDPIPAFVWTTAADIGPESLFGAWPSNHAGASSIRIWFSHEAPPSAFGQGSGSGLSPRRNPNYSASDMRRLADSASLLCGVQPSLFWSLVMRESSGRHWDNDGNVLRSSSNAIGLGQIKESTARDVSPKLDVFDPFQNALAASCHMRKLIDDYRGDVRTALHAYHAGGGTVRRKQVRQVTRDYANDVILGSAN